ncbi:MAG: hypothetical protein ABIU77_05235 [Ferruginibacter sp.]
MKKLNACLAIAVTVLFTSCVTTKSYTDEEKKMRNQDEPVYVIKKDGKKIVGSKISVPSIWNGKSNWIKIDDQKFEGDEVDAYQDKKASYARFGNEKGGWLWVKQLKRGKINLYYYELHNRENYYDGTKYVSRDNSEVHFVFKKGNGRMLESNITEIATMLKDNQEAYQKFTKQFGGEDRSVLPKQLKNHPTVLFSAVDIYNGA